MIISVYQSTGAIEGIEFPFKSKVMSKIAEIYTMPKTAMFPNYQRYQSQILIAEFEAFSQDCVKISRSYL